jgi:hypothetical protein
MVEPQALAEWQREERAGNKSIQSTRHGREWSCCCLFQPVILNVASDALYKLRRYYDRLTSLSQVAGILVKKREEAQHEKSIYGIGERAVR